MSTKISGMAAFVAPVLASDFVPVLHMPGGVPDATGPQKATLSDIRTAFMPVSLASEVFGTLPVARLAPSGTNGWVLTTTGGVPVWAAPSIGASSAGGSGQVQTSDGAGGFTAPTNVLAGSGFVSVGASPAASGALRLSNAPTTIIAIRDGANAADWRALSATATTLTVGDSANLWSLVELQAGSGGIAKVTGHDVQIFSQTTAGIDMEVNSQYVLWLKQDGIWAGQPIVGHVLNSSPYGVHAMTVKAMTGSTAVLTAAEYSTYTLKVTGTGTNFVKYPATTDAAAYTKYVWNAGAGTLSVGDSNAVFSAATLAAGAGAVFQFSGSAVKQLTAAFTVA